MKELYLLVKSADGRIYDLRHYQSEAALKKGLKWHGIPFNERLQSIGHSWTVYHLTSSKSIPEDELKERGLIE